MNAEAKISALIASLRFIAVGNGILFRNRFSFAWWEFERHFAVLIHNEVCGERLARFGNELGHYVGLAHGEQFRGLSAVDGLLQNYLVDFEFARPLVRLRALASGQA